MYKRQTGFTLIELVIVIVILGLLAATALPRFITVTSDARIAAINGVAGGMRSAVALARAQYVVTGNTTATTVTMDGQAVDVIAATGVPEASAAGIGTAIPLPDGWVTTADAVPPTAGSVTWTPPTGGSATCQIVYTAPAGTAVATVSGC